MPQEKERRLGRPVEVVDDEEDRLQVRRRHQRSRDRFEQSVLRRLGIGRRRRGHIGHVLREARHQARQLSRMTPHHLHEVLGLEVVDDERERLDERLVGNAQLVVAPAVDDGEPLRVDAARELAGQPCLADARLARHQDHRSLPVDRGAPEREQRVELGVAAHEREPAGGFEPLRERQAALDVRTRLPLDAQRGDRRGQALELERSDRREALRGP